jgi:hypothetical protein
MVIAMRSMTWLVGFTVPDKVSKRHLAVRRAEDVCHVITRLPRVRQHCGRSRRGAVIRVSGGRKTRQRRDGQRA